MISAQHNSLRMDLDRGRWHNDVNTICVFFRHVICGSVHSFADGLKLQPWQTTQRRFHAIAINKFLYEICHSEHVAVADCDVHIWHNR